MSLDTASQQSSGESRWQTLLRHDLPASLVVFLVALPLSLGIAVASDAPIAAGLIAAVVGGVVVGLFGGSPLQVSGPAAGLTVVVAETINQFGWKTACFITAAAGVLQILFGLSRIARAALAIAPVVVHAMLAGIGITIALQQVHVLLGGSSQSSALANITELPTQLINLHGIDVLIGGVVIAIMLGWKYLPAKIRVVPGPLVAVLVGTVLSLVVPADVERIALSGSLFDAIGLPEMPSGNWGAVVLAVLTIALIASVESLLCAVAVDKMHTGPRTNFDRELMAQGVANTTSGLLGGLPVTGVIVRSASNVQAGARTRASALLHGIWVLVFSVALVGVVEQIPKSVLAGLLIVVGIQLVKLAHIRLAKRTGDLLVYLVTVTGVVFLNLLEGVLIGLGLAFALLLWRVVRVVVSAEHVDADRWVVRVEGTCTFLALPRLSSELAKVPAGADVLLELSVDFLDHAAYEAIHDWARQHESTGGTVEFVELGTVDMSRALAGPPERGHARGLLNDVLRPWRNTEGNPITAGVAAYHRRNAHVVRPHLDELRDGQAPHSLFLTCADSRIVPNVITNTGPGDLFTVRNVGNLVPGHGRDTSLEAALTFALQELRVEHLVVCGHSGCGAMKALRAGVPDGPGLGDWLRHALPSLDRYRLGHPVARAAAAAGFDETDQLSMVNVAVQVETLLTHPEVRRAVLERGITVSGLFFDIATARVLQVTAEDIADIDDPELAELAGV
ncbi:bifunctional SulP family inorganic anion transporter/carbonic anhydrase [Nocardia otitidiscaviarum]|uniref:SulP family inorganic anion transporter n=1 Tax=Nocardia otitidiscaviarum TaxID=1823 RepID=UPI0004A72714|nr:bifunctional SulP family inorganic anion transporter/carbonic anhydrase [Nocardia otitidiscaviarum]MBF6135206.1 bifunctional SulP family inorganic anion transporter/carbonic anhydrase [Nocardia otitidiscaviarum]MBF6487027.1 bifunctional SulP family inorganic anion transporter/carbonic anhydrase [Nocardia otitidiscaviarum]